MKQISLKSDFPEPELVLFDLDGTLYDYDPAHQAAIEAVKTLVETQFEFKSMDFDRYFSDARMKVKEFRCRTGARSRLLYFKTMFELMGLGSSVLNTMNCEYVYWNTFVQNSRLFDGVTELIDELRIRKVPKILITNQTTSVQFKKLVYFDLEDAFDLVVTSEHVGVEKPARKIFDAAVLPFEVEPTKIWMFGDDVSADIEGARQHLGCVTFLKQNQRSLRSLSACKPDVIFEDYMDIVKLLAGLRSKDG